MDADGDGNNVINSWLNGDAKESKIFFTEIINNLQASNPPGMQGSLWSKPRAYPMKLKWKGFWELRKRALNTQYRLLCKMINREVYIVATAIHKDQKYTPSVSRQTAEYRVSQMLHNPKKYRRPHDFR
jgi:hypothetical protein